MAQRRVRKTVIISIICFALFFSIFLLWASTKRVVPIVMYHGVVEDVRNEANFVSVSRFEKHLGFLRKNGFRVISLERYMDAVLNERPLPPKSVVITFDDGYENNYTNAYPLLKKYGYPATIFVPANFLGQEGHLNVLQIKEMAEHDIAFGSHGLNHKYLPDLSHIQQREELTESKRILEEEIGIKIDYIAYPIGGFSEEIKNIAKEVGYKAALTTNRGFDLTNKDIYELKRVRLSDADKHNYILWMKLLGFNYAFRSSTHPH